MATVGNLELRLHGTALYASTTHDGDRVFESLFQLSHFLDSVRSPTPEQFKTWFRDISRALFPYKHRETLLGGVPDEVIMDIPRKLILYTARIEDRGVSEGVGFEDTGFEKACFNLKTRGFEILTYTRPEMRDMTRNRGTE